MCFVCVGNTIGMLRGLAVKEKFKFEYYRGGFFFLFVIVSVLFLIGLFLCIASYLILTGLNFIGLSYLLVYIGAVSILFLFILMLINVRISELLVDSVNSIPLAILIGSFFNYFVNNVLPYMIMSNNILYHFTIKKNLTNVTSVS
jgi:NADH-ubiquinone oxidoreductase chain 6